MNVRKIIKFLRYRYQKLKDGNGLVDMGPRMVSAKTWSDELFLAQFDIDKVNQLLDVNDVASARAALIGYYEERTSPEWPWFPDRISDVYEGSENEVIKTANDILENRFVLDGYRPVEFGRRIEWNYNPTSDPRARWTRELHRHRWWTVLAIAYKRTADERYSSKFVEIMTDWVESNPVPQRMDEGNVAWTLMGVGMRCLVWPTAFKIFRDSKEFGEDAKIVMLRSLYDHAQYLSLFHTKNNHLLRESNGLLYISALFPEFKSVDCWKKTALERLENAMKEQVNPDGTHFELSTGYQWLVVDEFHATHEILKTYNLAFSEDNLTSRLIAMYGVLAYLARPDGTLPQLNDGFMEDTESQLEKLAKAGEEFARQDFTFIGTSGDRGKAPKHTSFGFEDAKLYVMRDGWVRDSRYLLFDAGPFGGPHGHEDKLGIEVYAYGQSFIVDPGSYTYNQKDPFRLYFVSTQAHNTVTVAGKSQVRRWNSANMQPGNGNRVSNVWITTPDFDYVEGCYADGYASYSLRRPLNAIVTDDVNHIRRILFVKKEYWLVVDEINSLNKHDYEILFHVVPGVKVSTENGNNMVCLYSSTNDASLHISQASSIPTTVRVTAGAEVPIQGWYSNGKPNHKVPAPTIIYDLGGASSAIVTSLIYPSRAVNDKQSQQISIEQARIDNGRDLAYRIETPHCTDYVVLSCSGETKKYGPIETSANIAGLSHDSDGQVVASWEWSDERICH